MKNNIIKICQIEAACELAHDKTSEEVLNPIGDFVLLQGYEDEEDLFVTDGDNKNYKDEIQEIFNKYYDYYFEKLENLKQ